MPQVLVSSLDVATEACSYWSVMAEAQAIRRIWSEAVERSLGQEGVTLAIAPLRLLAESDGLLDRLQAEGLEPVGPDWRPVADETPATQAVEP